MNIMNLLKGETTQQELLNNYNANITYILLPNKIDGFVFRYRGIYNIFIDKNLTWYKKRKSILHELAHIELCQLDQIDNDLFAFKIEQYEDEADRYVNFILENIEEV